MKIPLKQNDIVYELDVESILFIASDRNRLTVETFDGTFHPLLSLRDYHKLLSSQFEFVDASTLVQIKAITRYDPVVRVAYFEKDGATKVCNVSRRKTKFLESLLF